MVGTTGDPGGRGDELCLQHRIKQISKGSIFIKGTVFFCKDS